MYIKATADIVIKYLMGEPEAEPILRSFINAVFKDAGFPEINYAKVVNPFNQKQNIEDKESILDIRAVASDGRIINIEIQTSGNRSIVHRSLYYFCRMYGGQLVSAQGYDNLTPAVCINLLEFSIFEHSHQHSVFVFKDQLTNEELTDHAVLHFIELTKINEGSGDRNLGDWLLYLLLEGKGDIHSSREVKALTDKNSEIAAAHQRYNDFIRDERRRHQYLARHMAQKDKIWKENLAKQEGLEKGRQEGRLEGRQEGKQEGKQETIEQIVLNMHSAGIDLETIKQITNLDKEEISQILSR
jgi:predicted transposase/invertase (TIGR01784 family)